MSPTEKKLPRINARLSTFKACADDYIVHGFTVSNVSKRHGINRKTVESWKKAFEWDNDRELYLTIGSSFIKILANVAKRAEKDDADPKDVQLFKDLHSRFIANDPNMRTIPNRERSIIVKMTLEHMRKNHSTTVDRFIESDSYENLVEAIVSF